MTVDKDPGDRRLVEPQPSETQPQDAVRMAKLFAKKAKSKIATISMHKGSDKKPR